MKIFKSILVLMLLGISYLSHAQLEIEGSVKDFSNKNIFC